MKKIAITLLMALQNAAVQSQAPIGLQNVGNTCYQNASLQCLYNITELTDFLISNKNTNYYIWEQGGLATIAKVYTDLVSNLKGSQQPSLAPVEFCGRAWQVFNLPPVAQADAGEFVTALLNQLAEENVSEKYKVKYPPPLQDYLATKVHTLFDIFLESTLTCLGCDERSTKLEPAMLLSVEVKTDAGTKLGSLGEAIDNFFKEERLDDYKCERCGVGAHRDIKLFNAPDNFIIQLKRFEVTIGPQGNVGFSKLNHQITIPFMIDLSSYYSLNAPEKGHAQYELSGITIHSGTFKGGHYWAYVKTDPGQWYKCNDALVTAADEATVKNIETQGYIGNPGATPYILYYRRVSAPGVAPAPSVVPVPQPAEKSKKPSLVQQLNLLEIQLGVLANSL